jgi:hypothetical protein
LNLLRNPQKNRGWLLWKSLIRVLISHHEWLCGSDDFLGGHLAFFNVMSDLIRKLHLGFVWTFERRHPGKWIGSTHESESILKCGSEMIFGRSPGVLASRTRC